MIIEVLLCSYVLLYKCNPIGMLRVVYFSHIKFFKNSFVSFPKIFGSRSAYAHSDLHPFFYNNRHEDIPAKFLLLVQYITESKMIRFVMIHLDNY